MRLYTFLCNPLFLLPSSQFLESDVHLLYLDDAGSAGNVSERYLVLSGRASSSLPTMSPIRSSDDTNPRTPSTSTELPTSSTPRTGSFTGSPTKSSATRSACASLA